MSNEEKMRKDFAAYWDRDDTDEEYIFAAVFGTGAKRRAAMAFYASAKACAAIKDAEIAIRDNYVEELRERERNALEEIAKLQKHNQDLRANALANEQANYDQVAKLVNEIAARDLMIKELREAMTNVVSILDEFSYENDEDNPSYSFFNARINEDCFFIRKHDSEKALAKSEHHNSRTLEKMLLEAELKGYQEAIGYGCIDLHLGELEAKLAELNKE